MRLFFTLIFFLCSFITPIQAGIIYVNGVAGSDANDGSQANPYKTIQKAIDNANAGDEIKVAAGDYAGFLVDRALTLTGPFADTPGTISKERGGEGSEAKITGDITFSYQNGSTVIKGFLFILSPGTINGALANGVVSNLTILNNIFFPPFTYVNNNIVFDNATKLNAGISQTSAIGTGTNWLISQNYVLGNSENTSPPAFNINRVNNIQVLKNTFKRSNGAIALNNVTNALVDENSTLIGNLADRVKDFGMLVGDNCGDVTISNNELINIRAINMASSSALIVRANSLTGNLLIKNNIIKDVTKGVDIPDAFSQFNHTFIKLFENSLHATNAQLYIGTQAGANARIYAHTNMWNTPKPTYAAIPPATVAGVGVPTVVQFHNFFDPNILEDGAKKGFQPNKVLIHTPSSPDPNAILSTLQQAIDATPFTPLAPIWELQASAYTYDEAITLNKPIILNGKQQAKLLPKLANAPQIVAITSDTVTFKNFTLDDLNSLITVGIDAKHGSKNIIRNLLLDNNIFNLSGKVKQGLLLEKGDQNIAIQNNIFNFTGNSVGAYIAASKEVTFSTNTFNGNAVDFTQLVVNTNNPTGSLNGGFFPNDIKITGNNFNQAAAGGLGIDLRNTSKGQQNPDYNFITIDNNTFQNTLKYYIKADPAAAQEFVMSSSLNVATNTFNAKTPDLMTIPELLDLEDKLVHKIDVGSVAFFTVIPQQYFVTPISFFAPTLDASIQRAVAIAKENESVFIRGGTYGSTDPILIKNSLSFTLTGDITVQNLQMNGVGKKLTVAGGDIAINATLTLNEGIIDNPTTAIQLNPDISTVGNDKSFVTGAFRILRNGAGPFASLDFPIGNVNAYRPINLANVKGNGNNPMSISFQTFGEATGGSIGMNIDALLEKRYWNAKSNNVTELGTIKLNYGNGDGVNDLNLTILKIAMANSKAGQYNSITDKPGGNGQPVGSIASIVPNPFPADAYFTLGISCQGIPGPTVSNTNNNEINQCEGKDLVLTISNPDATFTYTWTGPGIVGEAKGSQVIVPTITKLQAGDYKVKFKNLTGCDSEETIVKVNVIEQPKADFEYPQAAYCKANNEKPLPQAINGGTFGAFSSTAGIILDPATGEITVANSTPGVYTIKNTTPGVNGCTEVIYSFEVTIVEPVVATITPEKYTAFCEGGSVTLKANEAAGLTYQWQKDNVDVNGATNADIQTSDPGTYTVTITSVCGQSVSPGILIEKVNTPVVTITPDATIGLGEDIILEASGGTYYTWTPTESLSDPNIANPTASPLETTSYTVTVSNGANCDVTASVKITVVDEVFIPNTFTPNQDGKNDTFKVYGSGIEEINLKIFDRMGSLIFETKNVNDAIQVGWDGSKNGQPLTTGVYVWYVTGKLKNGKQLAFRGGNSGTVMLSR